MSDPLPYVDEHSLSIDAEPGTTWEALDRIVSRSFASGMTAGFARVVGCTDTRSLGPRPLSKGSAVPGFHVERADPTRELALAGTHRFSDYSLVFRLDAHGDGRTLLRAETRAAFPGLRGRIYRTLVIGTRIHVLVTRRLLGATKLSAERGRTRTA